MMAEGCRYHRDDYEPGHLDVKELAQNLHDSMVVVMHLQQC